MLQPCLKRQINQLLLAQPCQIIPIHSPIDSEHRRFGKSGLSNYIQSAQATNQRSKQQFRKRLYHHAGTTRLGYNAHPRNKIFSLFHKEPPAKKRMHSLEPTMVYQFLKINGFALSHYHLAMVLKFVVTIAEMSVIAAECALSP